MFGLKKKAASSPLKTGRIERQESFMAAVPPPGVDISDPELLLERLKSSDQFQILSFRFNEKEELEVQIRYLDQDYTACIFPEELDIPELFTINHQFTEAGIEAMQTSEMGITLALHFGEDPLVSYHLQLKMLDCATPDMIGLVDYCSERILSGLWGHMAAQAQTPPSPRYIYSIQAVSGDKEQGVWLHTHGLNRCGSIELEILNAPLEHYQNEATVLQTVADNIITRELLGEEYEGFLVTRFPEDQILVGAWVDWERALERHYSKQKLGGKQDRRDSHNMYTGLLLCYPDEDSFNNREVAPIAVFDEQLAGNPLMMISSEETARMRGLARERFGYLRDGVLAGKQGVVKCGILVDEEYREDGEDNLEHLWFEVERIEGDQLYCERTQEAYYIQALNQQTHVTLSLDQLTDWFLIADETRITPDSVYLLEQQTEA